MSRDRGGAGGGGFAVRRVSAPRRRPPLRRLILVAVVAVLLTAGGWWMTRGGVFAVERIETGSYRFTSQSDLEAGLAPLLGHNLWTLGHAQVSEALEPLPWIRDLSLRRRLPNILQVEFREWRPVLTVASDPAGTNGDLVLLEDGRLLSFPEHLPTPALPVLTGVQPVRAGDGAPWRLPEAEVSGVLELVSAMEDAGLEAICPVDFVVARAEGFAIVLQEGQGTLLVGREDFADRLGRYVIAREHLEPGKQLDLRFRDRITVK